ncbi:MAG: hypothetical protein QW328_08455 [Nitrososphaerota archaeon]
MEGTKPMALDDKNKALLETLISIRERLSSLETRLVLMEKEQDEFARHLSEAKGKIEGLINEINQYKGKLGGIIFGVTIMVAFLASIIKVIVSYWSNIVSFLRGG